MTSRCLILTSSLLLVSAAHAQSAPPKVTQYVPGAEVKRVTEEQTIQGWDSTLTLSANFALAQNRNVVGQPEGASYLVGFGVNGALFYVREKHELRIDLSLIESFSRTPALPRLVKANDLAKADGMYSYYFLDWLGGFGRLAFESPLLRTEDTRPAPTDYSITRLDGTTETLTQAQRVRLADGFEPFTLTQSVGLVANLIETDPANVTFRAGAGGRQTFAAGVLVVKDDAATPAVELVEVDDVLQVGVEAALGVLGKLPEYRLIYGVDATVLVPFLNNDPRNRSATELTRLALAGSLAYSMFEWLGVKYQLLLQRDRQLVEDLQVQNNVFLTFKYDVFSRKQPEVTKVDPLEEAKTLAAAAEARAAAAEERARAAEQRLQELEQTQTPAPEPQPAPEPAPTGDAPAPTP